MSRHGWGFDTKPERTRLRIEIEFKLRDFWVGVYWNRTYWKWTNSGPVAGLDVWICLVPCLPIHLTFRRKIEDHEC